jgi:hypothetical protein
LFILLYKGGEERDKTVDQYLEEKDITSLTCSMKYVNKKDLILEGRRETKFNKILENAFKAFFHYETSMS